MNKKKVNDAEQSRSSVIRYANEGMLALDSLKFFMGNATLANACKQMLQYYKQTAEKDIPKLTEFYLKQENFDKMKKAFEAKSASARTKEDVDGYNKGVKDFNQTNNKVNKERTQALNDWQKAEKEFADTHMPCYR